MVYAQKGGFFGLAFLFYFKPILFRARAWPDHPGLDTLSVKTIFYKKKWYNNSWKFFFVIGLIGFLSISCSVDDPSYGGRPASRSFTNNGFTYDDLKIDGRFHVVESEHPTCSFLMEFLNNEQIETPNRTYKYVIEDGIIHIIDPADDIGILVTLEILPQNVENSELISVAHIFRDRDAAEESGMWIGEIPPNGPYRYEAGWYRAKVQVGLRPYGIVLASTEKGDYLYVTNAFQNTVSVIRVLDNTIVRTIPVGRNPKRLAAAPDGSHVYVVNTEEGHGKNNGEYGTVSVLRTSDHANIRTIPVGFSPYGITFSPDGNYVYVTNTLKNLIRVIQTSDHTVLAKMPLGQDTLEYVEVYFGDLIDGSDYSLIAIEGECGIFSQVPDMTNPICRQSENNIECPLLCPPTVGKIGAVIRNVEPDENGYWFSGFLNDRFKNGTISLLLVENFTGAEGMDLDLDDNGILDYEESPATSPPWQNIVDEVAVDHFSGGGKIFSKVVLRGTFTDHITGSYSRIPNGIDTDLSVDWTRNNNYSSWLHSVYTDNDIFHLIDIPDKDKSYNSPGERNLLYGEAVLPAMKTSKKYPVINEFLLNRGEYRPLGVTAIRESQEDEDNYIYLSTEENAILKIRLSDYTVLERINLGINATNYSNTTDMTVLSGGDLYLVDEKSFSVTVIREGAVMKKIPVGFAPIGIASSFDGRYVFATSRGTNLLTVIRTSDNLVTEIIPLHDTSTGIAAPRSGNYIYVTKENENAVSVVVYTDDAVCN